MDDPYTGLPETDEQLRARLEAGGVPPVASPPLASPALAHGASDPFAVTKPVASLPGTTPLTADEWVASMGKGGASGPTALTAPTTAPATAPVDTAATGIDPTTGLPVGTKSVTTKNEQHSREHVVVTPEEKAHQQKIADTEALQESNILKGGDQAEKKALLDEDAAFKREEYLKQHKAATDKIVADAQAKMERSEKERDKRYNEWTQAKPEDFWDNDPKGSRKFWGGVALALGGYTASSHGGRNLGYEQIKDSIDRFDTKERDRIGKLKGIYDAASTQADKDHVDPLTMLSVKKEAAQNYAAAEVETRLKAMGMDDARIKTNETVLKLRADALQTKQADLASRRDKIRDEVTKHTQDIVGGADAAGKGRGVVDARQRAMTAVGLEDQMRIVAEEGKRGIKLTEEDRELIQRNRQYLKAIDSSHGAGSAMMTDVQRSLGMRSAPKNEFDGLPENKKRLAGAMNLASQKAAFLAAGAHTQEEMQHARGLTDLLAPAMGVEEQARRADYIHRDLIQTNKALVPTEIGMAERAAHAGEATKPSPNKGQLMKDSIALQRAINANPKAPRVEEARARLAEMKRQLGN